MAEPTQKRHGFRGNHLLPVIAGFLAFVALCCALWLFVSQPGTGSLFSLTAKKSTSSHTSSAISLPSSSALSGAASDADSSVDSEAVNVNGAVSAALSGDDSLKDSDWFSDAVFVGDSITGGISGYKILKSSSVLYSNGMSASGAAKTKVKSGSDSKTLLKALSDKGPKKIFLLLGLNDLSFSEDASGFASHYGTLLDKIHAQCPDATLYVQSVFPVTSAYAQKHSDDTNSRIDDFNAALKKTCAGHNARYVDVASILKGSDGALQPDVTSDGYNLKARYYYSWLNYLYANR